MSNAIHNQIHILDSMSTRSGPSSSCRSNPTCYFSIPLRNTVYDETPLYTSARTDELIPLSRPMASPSSPDQIASPPHYRMDASRFLQLQTQAATGYFPSRPQPQPVQNILHVDNSPGATPAATPAADESCSSMSTPLTARCSRCQRSLSIDVNAGKVSYGLNLYYCSRCAEMVGYKR